MPVAEAIEIFRAQGQGYKVELIEDLVRDEGVETVSLYRNGPFEDLCRGPHGPSTGRIKAIKLNSVAGAYWRGDESRERLTRIYGTAFFSKKDLEAHLERIEQAKARDHRRLGPQLGLFMLREEAPGMPFWLPNGTTLLHLIEDEVQEQLRKRGYEEIATPHVLDVELWHRSGHWDNYRDEHVLHGGRRAPLRAAADELPRRLPRLRLRAPLLPRAAAAPRRVRPRLPRRARGRPARPAPRARLHPGRRPRLLHRGPDRRRGGRASARRSTSSTRASASTTSGSSSRPGRRSRSAPTSSGRRPRRRCARRSSARAASTSSTPATAPSTARRSTSTSPTRWAAPGSAAPASSTSSDARALRPLLRRRRRRARTGR